MDYRGYRLMWVTDGVRVMYGSDAVTVVASMSDAKSVIDGWMIAP